MSNKYINLQCEQAILGSALMNNVTLLRVADILEDKHFVYDEHKAIWNRFTELGKEDKLANEITMHSFFSTNESTNVSYIFTPVCGSKTFV